MHARHRGAPSSVTSITRLPGVGEGGTLFSVGNVHLVSGESGQRLDLETLIMPEWRILGATA